MLFYCSEHMQKRELNTCKQDIYSFLHFLLPTNPRPSTDWVVFRLGETLMMKAECLLRSGDAQGAADIVNEVRRRSFDPSLPQSVRELTAEQLSASTVVDGVSVPYGEFLKELGREFTGEGMRREQLIRWDLYVNGSWTFHTPKQKKYLELYPIPSSELLSNINLRQNDGYSY